jgi:hypothetical protein
MMQGFSTAMFDLVVTSPPYEDARTYGSQQRLPKGQAWVDWFKPYCLEMLRVCSGLVVIVVEGRTRSFSYSATPMLLAADLHRAGATLRKPCIYHRNGIPGSGGDEWLRNDWEFVLCLTNGGRLPWANPTACGSPPKYKRGGGFTNRKKNGSRVEGRAYPTELGLANPGNVIKLSVGGGKMGHKLASENEAPFHVNLPAFFINSFCVPGGTVLDPFGGSHSTGQAALVNGRHYFGIDNRPDMTKLGAKRLSEFGKVKVVAEDLW